MLGRNCTSRAVTVGPSDTADRLHVLDVYLLMNPEYIHADRQRDRVIKSMGLLSIVLYSSSLPGALKPSMAGLYDRNTA